MKIRTAASINFCAAVFLCIIILVSGCADRDDYRAHAITKVTPAGFSERIIDAHPFKIFSLVKNQNAAAPWRIYIEGDGRSYINYELSADPTPAETTLLDLMLIDTAPNILYLARPCQFISSSACDAKYWSNARYGDDVLISLESAIMQATGKTPVELIGYSGGGTLAVLLAARMPHEKILGLRTIGANLSVKEQTEYFDLDPLSGSLDPIDFTSKTKSIPQIHLVAAADNQVIPVDTIRHYEQKLASTCAQFVYLQNISHRGPWKDAWQHWATAPFNRSNGKCV